jgi:hypothetical protein
MVRLWRTGMGKHILQIPSADGCIYLYDADRRTLKKLCEIAKPEDAPADVKETLLAAGLCVRTGEEYFDKGVQR